MKTINDFFNELQGTTSKNEKKEIVKKYKDDKDCLMAIKFLLDTLVVTGVAKKSLDKKVWSDGQQYTLYSFDTLEEFLIWSVSKSSATDNDLRIIHTFAKSYEGGQYADLVYGLVAKSIKLGISAKSVNEALGYNLIDIFAVQLAHPYDPKRVKGEVAAQNKYDGTRLTALKKDGSARFYARNGKEFEGLTELRAQVEEHMPDNYAIDGEMLASFIEGEATLDRYRRTQKISKKKGEKTGLDFLIFDMIPLDEFFAGESKKTYRERLETELIPQKEALKAENLEIVLPLYIGDDLTRIKKLELESYARGEEGLMIYLMDSKYLCKRHYGLMKLKELFSADILVTGVEPGEKGTKYENTLGALVCDWKGNRLTVSGMSDAERDEFWSNPESIIGKIIEINHNGHTQNQDGGQSVRFPRFKSIRVDKGIEDINYED